MFNPIATLNQLDGRYCVNPVILITSDNEENLQKAVKEVKSLLSKKHYVFSIADFYTSAQLGNFDQVRLTKVRTEAIINDYVVILTRNSASDEEKTFDGIRIVNYVDTALVFHCNKWYVIKHRSHATNQEKQPQSISFIRDDIGEHYTGDIFTYSCKADCLGDVLTFISTLSTKRVKILHLLVVPDARSPDTLFEFGLKEDYGREIISILKEQPNAHVMLETIKRCTLMNNDYSRSYFLKDIKRAVT